MNRSELLSAAENIVCKDRDDAHGGPEDTFKTIAALWSAYLSKGGTTMRVGMHIKPHDVTAMMALLKIARIAGNPKHMDSWVDLAGYAACGAEVATK